ncbi:hypothetical protein LOCC1_G007765 [Lachnellula occidentalis]|uniref:BTB domain-containing protein n=1 Tax=Lachnellula occidentalis TaxID=215460 RepID=A0A8H8UBF6_9HELO|nr:hypothetical protein LOCC1_G007765 [Lachnellula occidentalis]
MPSLQSTKTPSPTNSTPAKKNSPNFSNTKELVTFKIGKDDKIKTFVVHKEFACHYSPVLKAAFNSDFIEGQTQTYVLEDIGPYGIETFTLFVKWLYTQKLDLLEGLKDIVNRDNEYRQLPEDKQRVVGPCREIPRALVAKSCD